MLGSLGIRQSVGRTGICFDNALAESFNAAVKVGRVHRTAYPTRKKAREDIARYIEIRYNRKSHKGTRLQDSARGPRRVPEPASSQHEITQIKLSGNCEAAQAQFGNASLRQRITVGTNRSATAAQVLRNWRRHSHQKRTSERLSVPVAGRTASYARPPPHRASVRKPSITAGTRARARRRSITFRYCWTACCDPCGRLPERGPDAWRGPASSTRASSRHGNRQAPGVRRVRRRGRALPEDRRRPGGCRAGRRCRFRARTGRANRGDTRYGPTGRASSTCANSRRCARSWTA